METPRSNAGASMSCAPATGSGSYPPVKSKGVQAREAAKRAFVEPDADTVERFKQESRIGEFLKLASMRDEI